MHCIATPPGNEAALAEEGGSLVRLGRRAWLLRGYPEVIGQPFHTNIRGLPPVAA
jgi:hypothetical protein